MPQLDPSVFASQLFWLAVTFGILYWVMARIALPRIGMVLEERRDRIASDLDRAAMLRQEADEAAAAYEQSLAEARARAQALAKETRDKLAAASETTRRSLEADLGKKLGEAETRIAASRDEAMTNVRQIAVETAEAIVERLLGAAPKAGEAEAAVDTVMAR